MFCGETGQPIAAKPQIMDGWVNDVSLLINLVHKAYLNSIPTPVEISGKGDQNAKFPSKISSDVLMLNDEAIFSFFPGVNKCIQHPTPKNHKHEVFDC